tara:strand:+ start:562 stop:768 length:207 start_codon:yes stop_codon:yes gene_type:complete
VAKLKDVHDHNCVLSPGCYVWTQDIEDDGEPFGDKMKRLTAQLEEQFAGSAKLKQKIRNNLKGLGTGF